MSSATVAAFLFVFPWQHGHSGPSSYFNFVLFFATIIGISFVIGSACVFNNYLDRDIDRKMQRTQGRALVTGVISVQNALIYGTALGLIGLALLYFYVNPLTTGLALSGFIFYVLIYGIAKRKSHWGAVIGSVPGAVPIVVGYTAVANRLDLTALILFAVLVFWQMPHFYAIAMYRLDEYKSAGIPVLPAQKGMRAAKIHIIGYILAYIVATSLLWVFGYAGYFYLASILLFGFAWLWRGLQGFKVPNDRKSEIMTDEKWARKLFLFSLIVLVSFCITIAIAPFLP